MKYGEIYLSITEKSKISIDALVASIKDRPSALFFGAGIGRNCGGPSGGELKQMLRERFKGQDHDSFLDYMNNVILISETNRKEVEDFIKLHLSVISASDEEKYLLSLPWRVLFTTNYDRLPESIGTTLDHSRNIVTITDPSKEELIEITRDDILYCFQLMGSVNYSFPVGGWMILNSRDLNISSQRRLGFFRAFSSFAATGQIIYLGYSFDDEIVLNLLHEMRFVNQQISWKGYVVTPHQPKPDILESLTSVGVEWVQGTLSDLVKAGKSKFGPVPQSSVFSVPEMTIHSISLRLDRETLTNTYRKYEILTDSKFLPVSGLSSIDFVKGIYNSFYPYVMNWDYPRKVRCSWNRQFSNRSKSIDFSNFQKRASYVNSSENIAIALVGGAGSGKTTVINRLAHNWYKTGNPVLYIDSKSLDIDQLALEGMIDEVWSKYLNKSEELKVDHPPPLRFLIIADDAPNRLDDLTKLRDRLIATGKPADIILVARRSELPDESLKRSQIDYVMEIDDTVQKEEWAFFELHFSKLGALVDQVILSKNLRDEKVNSSFFGLLYTSVHGASVPLKQLIWNEFLSLDRDGQKLYAFTSLMQSLLLDPLAVLTAKSSDVSFTDFERSVRGRLGGVISYNSRDNYLSVPNRLIADIIAEVAFEGVDARFMAIKKVIQEVNPQILEETTLLHNLLTREGLFVLYARKFTANMKIELYKTAINLVPSRPLYIHLAREQMNYGNFSDAQISLKDARKSENRYFHEPDQHVYDAEGRLELRISDYAKEKGKIEEAKEHLMKAIDHFEDAIIDPFTTPHSYQGLAQTYFKLSELSVLDIDKLQFLLLAAQELSLADYSLETENSARFSQFRNEVFNRLSESGLNEDRVHEFANSLGEALGYGFLSTFEMERGDLDKAYRYAALGRTIDKNNIWLMKIELRILKKLSPKESSAKRNLLADYESIMSTKFDIDLSFELAMQKYFDGDSKGGSQIFSRIRGLERKYKHFLTPLEENRWRISGKPAIFQGDIIELPRGEYGFGWLHCENLDVAIPVWKKDLLYDDVMLGDRVNFEIIFNMIGPQSSKVRLFRR
jgi:hypothetical protein